MKWILTVLLVCLLYGSISVEDEDDWPMFQHDPQHSGYSSSRMPVPLKEVWTRESYCKFHDGTVYHLAISGDWLFVTNSMCFIVFNVNDGSEVWSDQYVYAFSHFPAIGNGKLVFSDASVIRCHDAGTGEQLWRFVVKFLTFSCPPIIVDTHVIVGGGHPIHSFDNNPETREEEDRAWDYARRVICLDSETGVGDLLR
jgi:outer membrane protein assembly factor BamB